MGSVTVWACDQAWCGDDESQRVGSNWGQRYDIVEESHWEQLAKRYCAPSWDVPAEIVFDHPVRIKPGQIRALYVHSALPDDLGIQYQSFRGSNSIAQDEIVSLLPGLGHTGPRPFNSGWYRGLRGLAGAISYTAMLRTWTPLTHHESPLSMRASVATVSEFYPHNTTSRHKCPLRSCRLMMARVRKLCLRTAAVVSWAEILSTCDTTTRCNLPSYRMLPLALVQR
jgi:hypothetical protein